MKVTVADTNTMKYLVEGQLCCLQHCKPLAVLYDLRDSNIWKKALNSRYRHCHIGHKNCCAHLDSHRIDRAVQPRAIVFHYSPLHTACVCVYSSLAVSLFLGLWPEVHVCVANQQKITGCDLGRTFYVQISCVLLCCSSMNVYKAMNSTIIESTNMY